MLIMKKALLTKLTLLTIVLAMAFALFTFNGVKNVNAAEVHKDDIAGYFTEVGGETFTVADDAIKVTVADNSGFSFKNKLVADDLAIELSVPEGIKSYSVILYSEQYVTGGIVGKDGDVENVLKVDRENGKVSLNDISSEMELAQDVTFRFTVNGDVLTAAVDGYDLEFTNDDADIEHKLAGKDKHAVKVRLVFEIEEDAEYVDVLIKSVDQKASDAEHGYKQTFVLDENNKITEFAKPRISITTMPLNYTDGKLIPIKDYKYTFAFTAYSVFGNVATADIGFAKDNEDIVYENKDNPKVIAFKNAEETEISVVYNDAETETYAVAAAVNRDDDIAAPYYVDPELNAFVYENYAALVQKAAQSDYTEGTFSIRLGEEYKIPSLEDLVKDDYDAYGSLSTTVYYRTPSSSTGSTTSMSFTVSEAGDYTFYVVFKDKNGNAMEKDSFFTVDEDDENVITEGEYFFAVFTFNVQDDAPLYVVAPASQGTGYVGTRYTATDFDVKSSGNNVTYTLYYNADKDVAAEGPDWKEVPKTSDIGDDYNAENGLTKSDIETINYDGKYTFTPHAVGSYKIVCTASSVKSVRFDSASTVIRVYEEKTEVKVDTHWLQNNIWSVIFLSIGTLALIGIIVLLFVKPKEVAETDATGDALKEKDKRN